MPTLLIGANLPDIDIVVSLLGGTHGLAYRRGWTHGVLAIALLPLLLTAVMLAYDRWSRRRRGNGRPGQSVIHSGASAGVGEWQGPEPAPDTETDRVGSSAAGEGPLRSGGADGRERDSHLTPARAVRPLQLLLVAYVAVASHPVLDWLNTYGLRWLMPFDGTWFYGDALFIVDPWLWLVLLGGVLLSRRTGRRGASVVAAAVAVVYIGAMLGAGIYGRGLVERGVRAAGMDVDDLMVGPVAFNPNRRHVVIRTGDNYFRGDLYWLPRPRLRVSPDHLEANTRHPAAIHASSHPEIQRFLRWSRYPFYTFSDFGYTYLVVLDDARYSDGTSRSWAAIEVEVSMPAFPGPPSGPGPAQPGSQHGVASR